LIFFSLSASEHIIILVFIVNVSLPSSNMFHLVCISIFVIVSVVPNTNDTGVYDFGRGGYSQNGLRERDREVACDLVAVVVPLQGGGMSRRGRIAGRCRGGRRQEVIVLDSEDIGG
jgi:hypothetical protein